MENAVDRNNFLESVADLFDIIIDDSVVESYPLFAVVLTDICNYAKSDIFRKADLELEEAKINLSQAKSSYFQLSIFSSAVQEVTNSNKNKVYKQHLSCGCGRPTSKSVVPTHTYFNMGMLNMHLILHGNTDILSSIGVTKEFISQHFTPPEREFVDQIIIPGVQTAIKKFCSSVLLQYGQEFNEKLLFAKMSMMPELLSQQKEDLKLKLFSIRKDRELYNRQIENYFECSLSLLSLLREKFGYQKKDADFSITAAHYACSKNDAVWLKARNFQLQILNEMYSPDVVSALKIIRQGVVDRKSSARHQLTEKRLLLQRYESIGKSFNQVVTQFSEVTAAIRNEEWALEQLVRRENL